MVGMDHPPSSFKQRAFRKLSSEASLRSFFSCDPSARPLSAQSHRSFTTCRSKMNMYDSFSLKENHSDDQLLCQKEFFDLTSPLSSSSASLNEKLSKTKVGKKLSIILSRLKADWNGMVCKKANKTKSVCHKRYATVDVAYDPQDIFTNESFFVHSSDVPQYTGISSTMSQKHYRTRNVTFDVDDDPFAAKSPMKLVAGKPVLPHKRERSLESKLSGFAILAIIHFDFSQLPYEMVDGSNSMDESKDSESYHSGENSEGEEAPPIKFDVSQCKRMFIPSFGFLQKSAGKPMKESTKKLLDDAISVVSSDKGSESDDGVDCNKSRHVAEATTNEKDGNSMPDKKSKVNREEQSSVSIAIPIKVSTLNDVTCQQSPSDDDSDESTQAHDDEDDEASSETQSSAPSSFFSRSSTPPFDFHGHLNWRNASDPGMHHTPFEEGQTEQQTFPRRIPSSSAFFENLDENDPAFYDNAYLQLRFLDALDPIFPMDDEEGVQVQQALQGTSISRHLRNDNMPEEQVENLTQVPAEAEESINRFSKTV
ncbi:uncharacterized protein FA14DRAFT_190424 [Meira miltonrushii]|uniref:Uncharacterized protein n=1 Tax=Meira miltonrushii TaxID=1280837 RepID=A0A316V8A2_9BASI|nr:uncharacterized protein FA14DRAFT_190424 [Meira miltonrushii]PWN33258.1 hypothetical protein FA14DRAFT_190424 [Meira miltonrushii]